MRKGFLIVMAVLLVAVLAAPAMAGMDASGFIRVKSYMSNFYTTNGGTGGGCTAANPCLKEDAPTNAYVEQRFRGKFSFGEENVKAVWFLETDFSAWGDSGGGAAPGAAARNSGGGLGGDKINLETKNIYIWFKLPNTSLDFTVGLSSQSDAFAGLLYGGADMAGIFMTGKYEPVSYKLGWAKLYENNTAKTDDVTLYTAEVNFAPTKDSKMGVYLNLLQDDSQKYVSATNLPFATTAFNENKKLIYTAGLNGTFNAGPATITGFALYQWGTIDYLTPPDDSNVKVNAYALDLRADMKLGPGKFFIEGLYISGSSNDNNDEYKSIITLSDVNASPGGNSAYGRTGMMILLFNGDAINTSQSLVGSSSTAVSSNGFTGSTSPGNNGRGLQHIAAGYTMPLGKQLVGNANIGWMAASSKLDNGDKTKKGKGMGTEVNANVNYNILKGLDFGVYGAYAWLGDFYKSNVSGAQKDPDDVYDLHLRLNYAF